MSPFSHVLVGLTHGRQYCGGPDDLLNCNIGNRERGGNAFTTAVGGGLDVKVFRFFWVRPIQADYVHVFFSNAPEKTCNCPSASHSASGAEGRIERISSV